MTLEEIGNNLRSKYPDGYLEHLELKNNIRIEIDRLDKLYLYSKIKDMLILQSILYKLKNI